jgi:hypothetical protein
MFNHNSGRLLNQQPARVRSRNSSGEILAEFWIGEKCFVKEYLERESRLLKDAMKGAWQRYKTLEIDKHKTATLAGVPNNGTLCKVAK